MVLQTTADTLEWDERTGMPVGAGSYRATQVSTLRGMVHELRTAESYGDDLCQLVEAFSDDDPHSDSAATVRELHRDWSRDRKLPTDLVRRTSQATIGGQQMWDAARKADDFSMFRDSLSEVVDLKREIGQRWAADSDRSPYEALLDEYEPNASVASLQTMFDSLRVPLVDLIAKIKDAPRQPDYSVLQRDFPIDAQRKFSHRIASLVGFDFDRGRLDETSHPFCTTLGPSDIRILTRFESDWLPSGIFGTLHEAGHGLYEQGMREEWFGLPPGSYVSLGMHESQSRLWENQVGRSHAFWRHMYGETQTTFSPQLDDVSIDEFHFAVNTIRPSLIRVEADEATYNLHIIIRFDLERQMIEGSLSIDDLPEAWNSRYESDLGIRPPSAADGVLQDVHWSAGLIGYFPTYTLGNLASAQLFDAAAAELGDLDEAFARGEFAPLLDWLVQNVHRHGRCFSGSELVRQATGSELSADALVGYLQRKLLPLYGRQ
ncbi:Thermostable carboxypeptidase 1 [Rubripirellula lacrimiformis]|uniref:Metal-dependent carboxypeptidase n=2 Tax=Rubripirellula lacrimiformis TaxID=1930273 RepID=A0A517NFM2_9BACT|nr:Thermostable carboxypeptidase 1 [Rubripirellula lacrimiformis]